MQKVIKSEVVLGRSTAYRRKRTTRITPTIRIPTPTILKPSPTKQPSTPTPTIRPQVTTQTQSLKKGEYGIAAGGNLPFLSQSDLDNYFSQLQSLGTKWVRFDI
jgi:hypothetical protein